MKGYYRGYCTFILKTLGLSRRKSPVQAILILLVESGFAFLGIQVSCFGIVPATDVPVQDPQSSHLSDRQRTC